MKKLLVAVDDSEQALKAVDFASELAARQEAHLCLVNVIKEKTTLTETVWEQFRNTYEVVATQVLSDAQARATHKGVKDIQMEIRAGDPAQTIVELANQLEVDAVVVGSHGHSQIAGLLLGSVSYKVVSHAPCTVIVVR